jgi:hypothetical protein
MNYYSYFLNSKGNRDTIYNFTLNKFNKRPIKILEIGAARSLNFESRKGDGWSTLHFVKYISRHGGSLDICDISAESLSNTKILLADSPQINVSLNLIRGDDFLIKKNDYDLILLDGSDDPNEMLKEYNLINTKISKVLCDDFHTKGNILRENFNNFTLFKWNNNSHEMALFEEDMNFNVEICPLIE